ncbi:multidrug transporter [Clostridium botulinum]|uniref:Probable multidrug resistance protein NorM n=1 Tax=Clostridium botulinum TaxID=1491 RepID=A0A9Q1UWK2_CLOBO|nr:MATE family efflux transporter [Clostridium botulinum]KEI02348.1 multidrug transporter [Clostridium botulinum D str. 16868]KEI03943.1 multidrug transporter [Clostridium botulinum C/D str. Sp77]KOA79741.1 multidrug transporter [Clostridium botulinum]KOA84763.1 multidrug transporter [Clostridium botulinum]KOA87074.1 multidrug transporter [Clostridium botulinum]
MLNKSIIKEVLCISFPVVCEMLVFTLTSVFSLMMVGNFGGNEAVAAVGLGNGIIFTFADILVSEGICIGIAPFVAKNMGARKYKIVEEYATIGFFLGVLISFLTSYLIFTFAEKILVLLGAKGNILISSCMFTKTTAIAIFFYMITNVIYAILRAIGNTYGPFVISSITALIKLILDVILIFGLIISPLGILGSAISSVISQVIGFLIALFYILFKSKVKLRIKYLFSLNIEKIKELLCLSIPSGLEEGTYSIGKLVGNYIIMYTGIVSFASHQITNSIYCVSDMIGFAFTTATTSLVGIKRGARRYTEANEYVHNANFCAVFIMIILASMFFIMPKTIVSLFIGAEEKKVIMVASKCLMISAMALPTLAIFAVYSGALKGMGDTKSSFIISLISSWVVALPLTFYVIRILKLPVIYAWYINVLQSFVEAVLVIIWYNYTRKRT